MTGWRQLRYAAQSLGRSPGLAAALVLSIALGIGSNAAVAGFVRGLVSRDLPVPHADRLVSLFGRTAQDGYAPLPLTQLRQLLQDGPFERLGAVRESRTQVLVGERRSMRTIAAVAGDTLDLLGLPPDRGTVISHRLWTQEFDGRAAEGTLLVIDGTETVVDGVAPEWLTGVHLDNPVDVWIAAEGSSFLSGDEESRTWWMLGRLRPGASVFDAQGTINATRSGADVIAVLPYTGMRPEAAGAMRRVGRLLTAAALAVFVIATVNVATFLLSRASARSRETAVRVALGASRRQLVTQLLADSAVIALAGAAAGALFALWTSSIVPSLFFSEDADALVFVPDVTAVALATIGCMVVMAACGLLPMLDIRHDDPAAVLKRENAGPSTAVRRLRSGLIVVQMACCCVLVIAAVLLLTGFRSAMRTAGSGVESTLLVTLTSRAGPSRPDVGLEYFEMVMREVQRDPAVTGAALAGTAPGSRENAQGFRFHRRPASFGEVRMDVALFQPTSLDSLVLPPIAGRMFGGGDRQDTCTVVLLNQEAADNLFTDNAVGQILIDPAGQQVEIVGVVRLRETPGDGRPHPPTVIYYGEQTGPPRGRLGPASFKIPSGAEEVRGYLDTLVVSNEYFDLAGAALVAGTSPAEADGASGCRRGVVSEEAAQLYFGGDAVGGAAIDAAGVRTEIVGVARSSPLRGTARAAQPALFLPVAQDFSLLPVTRELTSRATMLVRTSGAADDAVEDLQRRLEAVTGGGAPPVLTTLGAHLIRTGFAADRIALLLVSVSAAIGLTLGMFGLYGAMSEAGRRRRREFAVRVALGARGAHLVAQVLGDGLRLAAAGLAVGMLAALPVKHWMGVMTRDAALPPWIWVATPLVLLLAVAIASIVPARRAVAVNPLGIMRDE
jgi:putative ABC transport system permease protein